MSPQLRATELPELEYAMTTTPQGADRSSAQPLVAEVMLSCPKDTRRDELRRRGEVAAPTGVRVRRKNPVPSLLIKERNTSTDRSNLGTRPPRRRTCETS